MQAPAHHRQHRRLPRVSSIFAACLCLLIALPHGLAQDTDDQAESTTASDPCPKKTPKDEWKALPQLPEAMGKADRRHKSVWHDGRLWVFAGPTSGAALDVCTGEWTKFPDEKLSPPAIDAAGDAPRLDVRNAIGAYDADLLQPSAKLVRGPAGVELEPVSHQPKPYFGFHQFAGAKLRIDGGDWVELPKESAPAPRRPTSYAIARMGRKVAIWGGDTEEGLTKTGAVFDLDEKKWTAMAPENAPSARRSVRVTTWTGDALIVWGGVRHERRRGRSMCNGRGPDGRRCHPQTSTQPTATWPDGMIFRPAHMVSDTM